MSCLGLKYLITFETEICAYLRMSCENSGALHPVGIFGDILIFDLIANLYSFFYICWASVFAEMMQNQL